MRYLVDTNVFLYARGRDHPYRESCRRILAGVGHEQVQLDASVELLQEFVHVLFRRGADRTHALGAAAQVRRLCRMHAFDDQILTIAWGMLRHHSQLGARDAVHAATAVAIGVPYVLSTDRVFDNVADVARIDPEWLAAELG